MIVDEVITIMFAATQTTNLLLANTFYFFIKNQEVYKKVREEVITIAKRAEFQGMTNEEWMEILSYESLD
jgi:cytochrome P450